MDIRLQLTSGWRWALFLGLAMLVGLPGPVHSQAAPPQAAAQSPALQEAERLHLQAVKLDSEGKYDDAIPLAERVLAIYARVLGPDHLEFSATLAYLGFLYTKKGDYDRAEQWYQRALAVREKALGPEHPELVIVHNHLSMLYVTKGDFDHAVSHYHRVVAIQEKAFGPEHPEVARTLNTLGHLFIVFKPDYSRAEPLLQRALAIREKAFGPEHPEVAASLHSLGGLYIITSDYARAEPLLQRALAIDEKQFGPEHPKIVRSLSRLAALYGMRGDEGRAEPLYQRAMAISERALDAQHQEIADTFNELAMVYMNKFDYGRAEPLLQRALAIREQGFGPEHQKVAPLLDSLAELYTAKGDYHRAEPLLQRVVAIYEQPVAGLLGPLDVARALVRLAKLYQKKGDLNRAVPLLQRALAIRQERLSPEHREVADTLAKLAHVYSQGQDGFGRAEPLLRRALTIQEKVLGSEHIEVAISLTDLANLHLLQDDYERAEPLYQRALAIREKVQGAQHPVIAAGLDRLAALYTAKGNVTRALAARTRGNEILEYNLALTLATGSEDQKRASMATLTGAYLNSTVSLHTYAAPNDPQALRLALTTILRRKGRVLDTMTDSLAALRRRLDTQDQALLDQLVSVRSQLATLMLREPDKQDAAQYREQVAQLGAQTQRLEAQVSARSAEFRIQSQPVTIEQLQQAIPPGAALVELVLYTPFHPQAQKPPQEWSAPARYVAYVLRQKGKPTWADLGEAVPIDQALTRLRHALSSPGRTDVQELARSLDEKIMRPVRPLLGDARLILLSPDGALNLVPFGALVDEEQRYLVERFTFVYLTTGRDLLRLQTQSPERQGPVVIANPDFDGGGTLPLVQVAAATVRADSRRSVDFTSMRFGPLPGTAEEAVGLTNLLSKSWVLTGAAATEAALKQVHGPHILHIATHGFFLADQTRDPERTRAAIVSNEFSDIPLRPSSLWVENPLLRSGLALAGANQRQSGAEDGVLTALEAAGLDLWGTKLVVLSACETGVGAVQNGEGVYGLRRALVMAGAESQVMSLWKVADEATRDLMIAYYKRLLSGEGRAEALRQVQLAMLASEERQHPFYWAGFIPSGQWGPIGGTAK